MNWKQTLYLYKITVDTVDEIRPHAIYKAKAEIINEGMIELEKVSISDKSDEKKQKNENNSNETSSGKSEEIVNKSLEKKNSRPTTTKFKGMKSERNEHDEGKNDKAGNSRTSDKRQEHEISNSKETGDEQSKKDRQ